MSPPLGSSLFHITHGSNLAGILADGCLWSDAEMTGRGGPAATIGMSKIKLRRLKDLPVSCRPGTKVGQFVPFYFCPRSVMLYLLSRGNNPEVSYKGGQRPIVHLVADLCEVVAWAEAENCPWAFTDRNAGAWYFESYSDLAQLDRLNWEHIAATDWSELIVKDAKQAEFLVYRRFPWSLVRTIGVMDEPVAHRVRQILAESEHRPEVRVERGWYY